MTKEEFIKVWNNNRLSICLLYKDNKILDEEDIRLFFQIIKDNPKINFNRSEDENGERTDKFVHNFTEWFQSKDARNYYVHVNKNGFSKDSSLNTTIHVEKFFEIFNKSSTSIYRNIEELQQILQTLTK